MPAILTYAIFGTTVATIITGGAIYSAGQTGAISVPLSSAEAMAFGGLISAVDSRNQVPMHSKDIPCMYVKAVSSLLLQTTCCFMPKTKGKTEKKVQLTSNVTPSLLTSSSLPQVDPVSTLATFSSLKVEPDLNALCVGDSVINDAVAVVLYEFAALMIKDGAQTTWGDFFFEGFFRALLLRA